METRPKKNVLLYDGHCPFCRAQVEALKSRLGKHSSQVAMESFHEPGVLKRYPELNFQECMKEIKLVRPGGRILGGANAIFYTLGFNPYYRPLRWLYGLPLIKQIMDVGYHVVARNRYKISVQNCPSGTCASHQTPPQKS